MTTVHNLTTCQNQTFPEDPAMFMAVETLRIGYRNYAVTGWTKDTAYRISQGGSKVAGPVVGTFQHATVIAARPLPETRTFVDVQHGDYVSVGGSVYRIEKAPNDNIHLARVLGDEPGCGQDCACHDGAYSCHHIDPATSQPVWEHCACDR